MAADAGRPEAQSLERGPASPSQPAGTRSAECTTPTTNACGLKRAVTFTRTGDVDVTSLPDPASQPPRVVSPAEALHGRYHDTATSADGDKQEYDLAVRTDCVRT